MRRIILVGAILSLLVSAVVAATFYVNGVPLTWGENGEFTFEPQPLITEASANYTNSLVRWYTFPNIGTNYFTPDMSKAAIDGDIHKDTANEPTWVTTNDSGLALGSYLFDGGSDYIEVYTNAMSESTATSGTFTCWIKLNSNAEQFFFSTAYSNVNAVTLSCEYDKIHVSGAYYGNGYTFWKVSSVATISTGVWTHIGFTGDSSTYKLYINGTNTTVDVVAHNNGYWFDKWSPHSPGYWLTDAVIGRRRDNLKWLNGYMALPKLYDRTLSAAEVAEVYALEVEDLGL